MRVFQPPVFCALAVLLATLCFVHATEDLIIVEQDYSIIEQKKDGLNGKDIRQRLYITRDMLCIDEFGDNGAAPTESFLIDLKNQRIIDIDHTAKQILTNESFADRRNAVMRRQKEIQSDVDALETGAVKNRMVKMFGGMLDAKREYKIVEEPAEREIGGVKKCKALKIVDAKDPAYSGFAIALHPEMEMPYDNSEVLFLLKIVGEKMRLFLSDHKAAFSHVPMEMHLETAEGGKLDVKTVSVSKTKLEAFDPKSRALGDPFTVPDGYTFVRKLKPKAAEPVKENQPKDKPD